MDRAAGVRPHQRPGPFYQGLSEALAHHAQAVFELNQQQDDGATLADHIKRLPATHPGRRRLQVPPLPAVCSQVWQAFLGMRRRQPGGGFGLSPISYDTLAGWQSAHRARLNPWEVEQVFALDDIYLKANAPTPQRDTPPTHPDD